MDAGTELSEVLDDLYSSPPAEFTRTRDAYARQARAEGDRDLAARIGALKKPPTAAWAVNLLVRERRAEVEQLLALGEAMREATASLAGAELRDLGMQQHKVLDAMRVQSGRLSAGAGVRLSLDVGEQVVATLRAAMSDAAAADAVRSGLLVRPLESAGFGEVDVAEATAGQVAPRGPASEPAPKPASKPARRAATPPRDELRARREEKAARAAERERAEAERRERERRELAEAVENAREVLGEARDEAESAASDLASARRRADDLTRRCEDLRARLAAVAGQLEDATAALRTTERTAHAAGERVAAAERELERLTGRADR